MPLEQPRSRFWKILNPAKIGEWFRTLLILLGAPILGGVLVWQLRTLDPKQWCGVAFDMAKADGGGIIEAFKSCLHLQIKILELKDHAIIGLLAVIGLGYLMVMMRELRLQGEVRGPGGIGASVKHDPATEAAEQVASAAVNEAEVIKDAGVSR